MPSTIPFHSFMTEALYGPAGYYTCGVNFASAPARDFTTAPELTPLFGATLAAWVVQQWQNCGAPAGFNLLELGPGRGRLMHPLLLQLQQSNPACYAAIQQVQLVDVSPFLSKLQQETLKHFPQCHWYQSLTMLPSSTLPTFLIANEVFDALPAQPYRLTERGWEALHVAADALVWQPCPQPPLPHGWNPAVGASFDDLPALPALLHSIKQLATAALILDYGSPTLPPAAQSTVQAMQRHQHVPLLHQPGETDLTVHLNFADLIHQLGQAQCTLTPLADFLLHHGLATLALPLLQTQPPHPTTQSALHRLLHPAQMGTLHYALCYTRSTPIAKSLPAS